MKLGGEFNCPYCNHIQERDIEYSEPMRCDGCGDRYYAWIGIKTFTWKIREVSSDGSFRKSRECQSKGAVSQA